MPVLRADAHMTTIDAVIKGYMKWRMSSTQRNAPDYVSINVTRSNILGASFEMLT